MESEIIETSNDGCAPKDDSDNELYAESNQEKENVIVITNQELVDEILQGDSNVEAEPGTEAQSDSDSDVDALRDEDSEDEDDINVIIEAPADYPADLDDAAEGQLDEEEADVNVVIKRAARAPTSTSGLVVQQAKATTTTQAPQKTSKVGLDLDDPGNINGLPTIEFDVSTLREEEKGWKLAGTDLGDFFNFGFNEETWIQYCNSLNENRPNGSASVIVVNSAIRMRTASSTPHARNLTNTGGKITVLGSSSPAVRPISTESFIPTPLSTPINSSVALSTPNSAASPIKSSFSTISSNTGSAPSSTTIPTVSTGTFPNLPPPFNQPPPPRMTSTNFSMPPPGFFPPGGNAAVPPSFLSVPPMMHHHHHMQSNHGGPFLNTALPPPVVLPHGSFGAPWQLGPSIMTLPPGYNPDMPPPREATPDSMKSGEDYSQFDPSEVVPTSRSRRDRSSRSPDRERRERRSERRRHVVDKRSSRRRSRSTSRSRSKRRTPKQKYKPRERSSSRSRSSRRAKASKRRSKSPKMSSRYKRSPDSVERGNANS